MIFDICPWLLLFQNYYSREGAKAANSHALKTLPISACLSILCKEFLSKPMIPIDHRERGGAVTNQETWPFPKTGIAYPEKPKRGEAEGDGRESKKASRFRFD